MTHLGVIDNRKIILAYFRNFGSHFELRQHPKALFRATLGN